MASVNLSTITVPTPEPYDNKNEHRQRENLCFVILQIFQRAKAEGWTLTDAQPLTGNDFDLSGVQQAIQDLQFQGTLLDAGGFKIIMTRQSAGIIGP